MEEIPNEILANIAGYLSANEALKLNVTSKKLHSNLALTVTSPREIISTFVRQHDDLDSRYAFQIPIPDEVSCHSILLSCVCLRPGRAMRDGGRLYIVAYGKDRSYEDEMHVDKQFQGGRVVNIISTIAPFEGKRLNIVFQPKARKTYHLWYDVDGCEDRIALASIRIQALVMDDELHSFGEAFKILMGARALPPWNGRLRRDFQLRIDNCLSNTVMAEDTARYVQTIRTSWNSECDAHASLVAEQPSQKQGFGFMSDMGDSLQDDDDLLLDGLSDLTAHTNDTVWF